MRSQIKNYCISRNVNEKNFEFSILTGEDPTDASRERSQQSYNHSNKILYFLTIPSIIWFHWTMIIINISILNTNININIEIK